jgi:hypothetical protein
MLNPVSQIAVFRAALGATAAVTRAAGAAGDQLSSAAGSTFKEIFAQPVTSDAQPQSDGTGVAQTLLNLQGQLLDAVRGALARAGIDLSQSRPFEVVINSDGGTSIAQGHPQQSMLEMVLEDDPAVTQAMSQLKMFRSAGAGAAQSLRVTVQPCLPRR